MPETRTGPLVQKLVSGLQEDIAEAVQHLQRGRDMIRSLESETRGVNGLAAFLRSQGQALDKMMGDMTEEASDVEKKMLGQGREITTSVDTEKMAAVKAAKGGA